MTQTACIHPWACQGAKRAEYPTRHQAAPSHSPQVQAALEFLHFCPAFQRTGMVAVPQITATPPRWQHLEHPHTAPVPVLRSHTTVSMRLAAAAERRGMRTGALQPCRRSRRCPPAPAATSAGVAGESAAAGAAAQRRKGDEYFSRDSRSIILFDGVCNLCNGGVNFMLHWDHEGRFRFAALQSPAGRALLERSGRSPDDISSIVLVEAGASYIKSAAILRIAAGLQLPLPLVAAALDVFPRPFKDAVYDQVGRSSWHGCDCTSGVGQTEGCLQRR